MILRKKRLQFLLGVAALAAATVVPLGPAAAADPPPRVELTAEAVEGGLWTLRAELTRGGQIQSGQPIEFFQLVEFFGARSVPLGSAMTDAAGTASLAYSPTSNGVQKLVARHTAEGREYASEPVEITVSGAVPAIPVEGEVLPLMRMWAFPVAAALLFLVWLALAGILLGAVIGIARSQPDPENPGTPAPPGVGSGDPAPNS